MIGRGRPSAELKGLGSNCFAATNNNRPRPLFIFLQGHSEFFVDHAFVGVQKAIRMLAAHLADRKDELAVHSLDCSLGTFQANTGKIKLAMDSIDCDHPRNLSIGDRDTVSYTHLRAHETR